jgi:hypothetical protein
MQNFIDLNVIKFVDLSLQIGRPEPGLGLESYLKHSIYAAYNNMNLESGSTYYFGVYFSNQPLTRKNVPYEPIKLSILDINNSLDIKKSVHSDNLTHDYFSLENLLRFFKNKYPITNKYIFYAGISSLV